MFDTRLIGIPNDSDEPNIIIALPRGWEHGQGIEERQVEVGHPILVYATILSVHEARERNRRYREQAEASLGKRIEEHGPDDYLLHMDRSALAGADQVDQMLDKLKKSDGYFASWVIVERCTID